MNAFTDISRSVHPDILKPLAYALDNPGTAGRSAYNAGRIALAVMHKACAVMRDAEHALETAAPPVQVRQLPGQRTQMAGDVGTGPVGLRLHYGLQEELVAAADRTFNRTARTVNLRLAEMKAHASILEEKMAEALRDPRGATAAAPPLLSSVGSVASSTVRDQPVRRWTSVEHEQARAIAKAVERVMTAFNVLASHYARVLILAKGQRHGRNHSSSDA